MAVCFRKKVLEEILIFVLLLSAALLGLALKGLVFGAAISFYETALSALMAAAFNDILVHVCLSAVGHHEAMDESDAQGATGAHKVLMASALLLAVLALGTTFAVFHSQQPVPGKIETITLSQLKNKLASKDTFVVSILLEGCPYCEELQTELELYTRKHPATIEECTIAQEEKSSAKLFLTDEFPRFQYFPSVYYVSDGVPLDKLDLSDGADVQGELDAWADAGILPAD